MWIVVEEERIAVTVDADERTVVAQDADGEEKWRADIMGEYDGAIIGKPVVRAMRYEQDRIIAVFGKHSFAAIDPITGAVTYLGSD